MAKKETLTGINIPTSPTARTEPAPTQAEQADVIKPVGIGLKVSEWAHFDTIAGELGMKRHALALWVMRDFMARYERGEIKTETKKSLPGL